MAKPRATTIQQRFGFQDSDLKTSRHDDIMIWLDQNIDTVINDLRIKYPETVGQYDESIGSETTWEQPIMSGLRQEYCIGFIDMYIKQYNMFIEVKATIPSLGELIRQIKMYKQYIARRYGGNLPFVVVSPDARFVKILESQNILFYHFNPEPIDAAMI